MPGLVGLSVVLAVLELEVEETHSLQELTCLAKK